jgi:hypothetical protein
MRNQSQYDSRGVPPGLKIPTQGIEQIRDAVAHGVRELEQARAAVAPGAIACEAMLGRDDRPEAFDEALPAAQIEISAPSVSVLMKLSGARTAPIYESSCLSSTSVITGWRCTRHALAKVLCLASRRELSGTIDFSSEQRI